MALMIIIVISISVFLLVLLYNRIQFSLKNLTHVHIETASSEEQRQSSQQE